jgi:NhaP-type Na+/H+ or K+/H+ antiporter
MVLGKLEYGGVPLFNFKDATFLISLSILTLVMVVFDGSSRFNLKEIDTFYMQAIKLMLIFMTLSILIIAPLTYYFCSFENIFFAIFFAVIISGTDPTAMFSLFGEKSNKVSSMLEIESVLNTPIIVIFSFLILDMVDFKTIGIQSFVNQITPLLLQITVAIGTGMLIGIIFFKTMRKFYNEQISPLVLIAASLLSYLLAEALQGNGVLAVATLGLFFGNVYIKQKEQLQEFSSTLSQSFEILVFLILGIIIDLDINITILLKSIVVFLIFLAVRYIAVRITFYNDGFNLKEQMFMSLNIPKGIAVAVIVFTISLQNIQGIKPVLDLVILFMIYSLLLSSFIARYSKKFIRIKIEE